MSTEETKNESMPLIVSQSTAKVTLKELRENIMPEQFEADLNATSGFHVYKCFVGVGKTTMYRNKIKDFIDQGKTVLIAFPTHKLKNENVLKLKEMLSEDVFIDKIVNICGIPAGLPESFYIQLQAYYSVGDSAGANIYISKYLKKAIKPDSELQYEETLQELKNYIDSKKLLMNKDKLSGKIILTTHERLFTFSDIKSDVVIIDEDIIDSKLKQGVISLKQISAFKELLLDYKSKHIGTIEDTETDTYINGSEEEVKINIDNAEHLLQRADEVLQAGNNYLFSTEPISGCNSLVQHIVLSNRSVLKSRFDELFCESKAYIVSNDKVSYILNRELKLNGNIFVMSATANEQIYKEIFGSDIHFHEFPIPELATQPAWYPLHSYSRTWMEQNKESLTEFMKAINLSKNYKLTKKGLIKRDKPIQPLVITFKKYENILHKEGFNVLLHYGNVEGYDEYKGMNLALFGTPHINPVAYTLQSAIIYPEINLDKIPGMSNRFVEINGYQLKFFTVGEELEEFRKVQFWNIESELIQALGRARPLDNKAFIAIYSAYPLNISMALIAKKDTVHRLPINEQIKKVDITKMLTRYIDNNDTSYESGVLYKLPIEGIQPDPEQPRKTITEKDLSELEDSIRKHGVLQPIIFRIDDAGNKIIVAGERRFQASKNAGLKAIPAMLTEGIPAEIALIENIQRKNLTPIEEAEALNRLTSEYGYTYTKIAEILGKARSTVSEVMSLNKLPDEIRNDCKSNPNISRDKLVEIVKMKDEASMLKAYNRLRQQSMTREELRTMKQEQRDDENILRIKDIEVADEKYTGNVAKDIRTLDNYFSNSKKILKKHNFVLGSRMKEHIVNQMRNMIELLSETKEDNDSNIDESSN